MHQDELGIYDIYSVIYTPFWQRWWVKWALIFFGIMIISFLLWSIIRVFIFSKAIKQLSSRQIVLQRLTQLNNVEGIINNQKVYADLGFILRLFLTDWHQRDLLSLTEHEIENHIAHCALCAEQFHCCVLSLKNNVLAGTWRIQMHQLLERMSDSKYKAESNVQNDVIMHDINLITALVHSVYFKK